MNYNRIQKSIVRIKRLERIVKDWAWFDCSFNLTRWSYSSSWTIRELSKEDKYKFEDIFNKMRFNFAKGLKGKLIYGKSYSEKVDKKYRLKAKDPRRKYIEDYRDFEDLIKEKED